MLKSLPDGLHDTLNEQQVFKYALGCDDGLIPSVAIELLSSYPVNDAMAMDFCLTPDGYESLKLHFFKMFKDQLVASDD